MGITMSDFVEFLQSVRRLRKGLERESQADRTVVMETPGGDMSDVRSFMVRKAPYITQQGDLIIPFDSDSRYHWWSDGQSILDTLFELKASEKVLKHYVQNWRAKLKDENLN